MISQGLVKLRTDTIAPISCGTESCCARKASPQWCIFYFAPLKADQRTLCTLPPNPITPPLIKPPLFGSSFSQILGRRHHRTLLLYVALFLLQSMSASSARSCNDSNLHSRMLVRKGHFSSCYNLKLVERSIVKSKPPQKILWLNVLLWVHQPIDAIVFDFDVLATIA